MIDHKSTSTFIRLYHGEASRRDSSARQVGSLGGDVTTSSKRFSSVSSMRSHSSSADLHLAQKKP